FAVSARLPPPPTLSPYTTLFRSARHPCPLHRRPRQAHHRPEGGRDLAQPEPVDAAHLDPGARSPARHPGHPEIDEREHGAGNGRSEEHTSELQSRENLVCRLLLE